MTTTMETHRDYIETHSIETHSIENVDTAAMSGFRNSLDQDYENTAGNMTLETPENKVTTMDVVKQSPYKDSIGYWNSVGGGFGKIKPSGAEDTERKSGNQIYIHCKSQKKTRYLNSLNRNRFFIRYYASVANKSDFSQTTKIEGKLVKGIYQKIGAPRVEVFPTSTQRTEEEYGITLKVKRIDTIKPFQFKMDKSKPNPYGWKFYDKSDLKAKKDCIMFTCSTDNVRHRHRLDVVRIIQENKIIIIQRFMKSVMERHAARSRAWQGKGVMLEGVRVN
jgi:hypothetical protein